MSKDVLVLWGMRSILVVEENLSKRRAYARFCPADYLWIVDSGDDGVKAYEKSGESIDAVICSDAECVPSRIRRFENLNQFENRLIVIHDDFLEKDSLHRNIGYVPWSSQNHWNKISKLVNIHKKATVEGIKESIDQTISESDGRAYKLYAEALENFDTQFGNWSLQMNRQWIGQLQNIRELTSGLHFIQWINKRHDYAMRKVAEHYEH